MATQDIRAKLSYHSVSAQKVRLVIDLIRGKDAVKALEMLRFVQKRSAEPVRKLLASAVANAGLEPEEAIVTSARVDRGPVLKRFTPRARGSASPKHRPTAHIMIEVAAATEGDK